LKPDVILFFQSINNYSHSTTEMLSSRQTIKLQDMQETPT